jgi:hypothetical protein
MLFSPLRDIGTTGPYLPFETVFSFKLYQILFLKESGGHIHLTTEHPVTMLSTDSPSSTATPMPEPNSTQPQTQSNGNSKPPGNAQAMSATTENSPSMGNGKAAANAQASTPAKHLTPAELKKKAKEEKAARRAQAVAAKEAESAPAATETSQAGPSTAVLPPTSSPQNALQKGEAQKGHKTQQRGPAYGAPRNLPVRSAQKAVPAPLVPKKEDKTVEFFRHLYKPRTTSIAGASKEVHPAILALGLQMANYTVCGSCARLVAMLQAFKRVSSYQRKEFLYILIVVGH